MTPTGEDVARNAGVSRGTVSQILGGHADRFSVDTAERVFRAARFLDYRPSLAARALRRGKSDFVVAMIPDTANRTSLSALFGDMTGQLSKEGYTLVLRLADGSSNALDRIMTDLRPAAVIFLMPLSADQRAEMDDHQTVIVAPGPAARLPSDVDAMNTEARRLTTCLLEQLRS